MKYLLVAAFGAVAAPAFAQTPPVPSDGQTILSYYQERIQQDDWALANAEGQLATLTRENKALREQAAKAKPDTAAAPPK